MSWQTKLARAKAKHKAKNKFGANLTAGKSKLERAVDDLLCLREKAGEIKDLKRQQTLVLLEGDRSQRITWRIDFAWTDPLNNAPCFAEAKGFPTPEYKLKLKLFRANPQGRLEIWGGTYTRPQLMEIIEP